jgi:hypothetical protein
MHNHARLFIDHQDVRVLVKDLKVHGLGRELIFARDRGGIHDVPSGHLGVTSSLATERLM